MTEKQLRSKAAATMAGWLGLKESDGSHMAIVDIYNAQAELPRSYKLKQTDAWCAATISACAIVCGLTDIMPTECSVEQMRRKYADMGRWQEDDGYVPQIGDLIVYDWGDSGKGDNTGWPDHIGMVTACDGKTITAIEGNKDDAVGERKIAVGAKCIRGYCLPDYASKATGDEVTFALTLPQLRRGDEGLEVCCLQALLIHVCGCSCGKSGVDGIFGDATEKAVKAFQRDMGLTVDGIVGPLTAAALVGA